jgi:Prefoldin subunit
MSVPSTTTPTQQVNVSDLELPQLVEVKRQLEEVRSFPCSCSSLEFLSLLIRFSVSPGTLTSNQFFRPTEASAGQVPVVHRKRKGGQAREQRYGITSHLPFLHIRPCTRLTTCRDKTILVPLTSSLYVPGKLRDVENVIIDVGTGYYVQKVRGCFFAHVMELSTRAPVDASSGSEVLRREDRVHQDKSGRATGDDREEAGQYVLSPQRHTNKAPSI